MVMRVGSLRFLKEFANFRDSPRVEPYWVWGTPSWLITHWLIEDYDAQKWKSQSPPTSMGASENR